LALKCAGTGAGEEEFALRQCGGGFAADGDGWIGGGGGGIKFKHEEAKETKAHEEEKKKKEEEGDGGEGNGGGGGGKSEHGLEAGFEGGGFLWGEAGEAVEELVDEVLVGLGGGGEVGEVGEVGEDIVNLGVEAIGALSALRLERVIGVENPFADGAMLPEGSLLVALVGRNEAGVGEGAEDIFGIVVGYGVEEEEGSIKLGAEVEAVAVFNFPTKGCRGRSARVVAVWVEVAGLGERYHGVGGEGELSPIAASMSWISLGVSW
jgi:hypothetical protein